MLLRDSVIINLRIRLFHKQILILKYFFLNNYLHRLAGYARHLSR